MYTALSNWCPDWKGPPLLPSPLPPAGFQMDDSLFSALDSMDILVEEQEAPEGGQVMVSGAANSVPVAVGYLISTSPPGHLPEEFWGYERSQCSCSMFKVSCHTSPKNFVGI